ncbi:hypothetical protein [Streptomyces sp. NPDC093589]|uniref:hypothetical protein n=1 Tax=Streptomyces sp. NPDC093589 TaxID=3366043 RepID=UPI0037F2783B
MDETEQVSAALSAHYPRAAFDATGAVARAGFLASPGLPGSGTVRVSHRELFPSSAGGKSFADIAEAERAHVDAYAQLLCELGWLATDRTTNRPRLLVSKEPSAIDC